MSTTTTPVTGAIAEGTGTGSAGRRHLRRRPDLPPRDLPDQHGRAAARDRLHAGRSRSSSSTTTRTSSSGWPCSASASAACWSPCPSASARLRTDTILLWGSPHRRRVAWPSATSSSRSRHRHPPALGLRHPGVVQQPRPAARSSASRSSRRSLAIGVMIATLFGRRTQPARPPLLRRPARRRPRLRGRGLPDPLHRPAGHRSPSPVSCWPPPAVRIALRDGSRVLQGAGVVLAAVMLLGVVAPNVLPDPHVDRSKSTVSRDSAEFSKWSPIFRVDVQEIVPGSKLLFHDGLVGLPPLGVGRRRGPASSASTPTSGRSRSPALGRKAGRRDDHRRRRRQRDPRVALLRRRPHRRDRAQPGHPRPGHRPVRRLHGPPRRPARRQLRARRRPLVPRPQPTTTYDLVWYPAPDSYAATNAASSGAFVLSESYLYTKRDDRRRASSTSAATASWRRSSARSTTRTSRTAPPATSSTVREALERAGHRRPGQPHDRRRPRRATVPPATISTILVKRTPFTPAEVARFTDADRARVEGSELRHAPGRPSDGDVVDQIITAARRPSSTTSTRRTASTCARSPTTGRSSGTSPVRRRDPRLRPDDRQPRPRVAAPASGCCCSCSAIAILFARGVPAAAVRRSSARRGRRCPARASSALYFAAPRARVHVLRDHADPEAHAVPRLPDLLADRHARVDPGLHRRRRAAERPARRCRPGGPRCRCSARSCVLTLLYLFGLPADHRRAASSCRSPAGSSSAFLLLAPLGLCLGMFMPLGLTAVSPAHHPLARVRRVGLGGQRLRLGDRLGAHHDAGDDLRLRRGPALRPRRLRRWRILALRGLLGSEPTLPGRRACRAGPVGSASVGQRDASTRNASASDSTSSATRPASITSSWALPQRGEARRPVSATSTRVTSARIERLASDLALRTPPSTSAATSRTARSASPATARSSVADGPRRRGGPSPPATTTRPPR